MIGKIGPLRGAWDEDTVMIREKLNEIVDILNDQKREKPMSVKTPADLLKPGMGSNVKPTEAEGSDKEATEKKKSGAKQQKRNTKITENNESFNL